MSAVAKTDWHFIVRLTELAFVGACLVLGLVLLYFELSPLYVW